MALELTVAQQNNASAGATRPIFIAEIEYAGGAELLSTESDVVFDGRTFVAGLRVTQLSNTVTASLELAWTPERVTRVQAGAYRGNACRIWYIPAAPDDQSTFDSVDGIQIMDGLVQSSSFGGGRIGLGVLHRSSRETLAPRLTLDQFTAFAAASGRQIEWDGEIITLESRR